MDKVFALLGLEALDESVQTEIKEKLSDIIDIKAKELAAEQLTEAKEGLIEEYEDKFEEYKNDITSKFSNFVDSVMEEELSIPENILEYAHKGELYSDLIEQFKIRLGIDEGVVDEEVKGLLREAKDEIISLKEQVDSKTYVELEQQKDLQEMAAALYIRKKCDGLTESQKTKIFAVLEGIVEKKEIDRKFDLLVESVSSDDNDGEEIIDEEVDVKGEGQTEIENKEMVNESSNDNPFDQYVNQYVGTLRDNKL